jgi:hypothetical protein
MVHIIEDASKTFKRSHDPRWASKKYIHGIVLSTAELATLKKEYDDSIVNEIIDSFNADGVAMSDRHESVAGHFGKCFLTENGIEAKGYAMAPAVTPGTEDKQFKLHQELDGRIKDRLSIGLSITHDTKGKRNVVVHEVAVTPLGQDPEAKILQVSNMRLSKNIEVPIISEEPTYKSERSQLTREDVVRLWSAEMSAPKADANAAPELPPKVNMSNAVPVTSIIELHQRQENAAAAAAASSSAAPSQPITTPTAAAPPSQPAATENAAEQPAPKKFKLTRPKLPTKEELLTRLRKENGLEDFDITKADDKTLRIIKMNTDMALDNAMLQHTAALKEEGPLTKMITNGFVDNQEDVDVLSKVAFDSSQAEAWNVVKSTFGKYEQALMLVDELNSKLAAASAAPAPAAAAASSSAVPGQQAAPAAAAAAPAKKPTPEQMIEQLYDMVQRQSAQQDSQQYVTQLPMLRTGSSVPMNTLLPAPKQIRAEDPSAKNPILGFAAMLRDQRAPKRAFGEVSK